MGSIQKFYHILHSFPGCGDADVRTAVSKAFTLFTIYEQSGKIHSDITVETTGGEVSKFSIRSKIGENFLIIGLPSSIFNAKAPMSEAVIMIVPRLIRTMQTDRQLEHNL